MFEETDPFALFSLWYGEAKETEPSDPHAMSLATATPDGIPSVRVVLMRGVDQRGFVFYTNRTSRKGRELAQNQRVMLDFHWKTLKRQVLVEGSAGPVPDAEADAYFASRPRDSRIGAWASMQSAPLASREIFEERIALFDARYPGEAVPRPPYWSGFRVVPSRFEFWCDRPFRLHDRLEFRRDGDGWTRGRLYP